MKISKKWLEQYMDLSDLSMNEIANRITDAGFEVEEVTPMSSATNLVIGQVEPANLIQIRITFISQQ